MTLDFVDLPEDDPHRERQYSEHLYCPYDDLSFEELEPRSFSFNSPFGACAECHGLGTRMEVDPELVVPDPALSLEAGALSPWSSAHTSDYFGRLVEALADSPGFPHGRGVAAAARQGSQDPCSKVTPSRCTSATRTGTAASAPTTRASRGSSPTSNGGTRRPRAT